MAGMIADMNYEGLGFVRDLDDEDTLKAELPRRVANLVDTLDYLFVQGKCVAKGLLTFTRLMFDQLKQPTVLPLRGGHKILGGPTSHPPELIARCLQRMQGCVKASIKVLQAEFPHYEILWSFQIFSVSPGQTDVTPELDTCFERLANF